MAVGDGARPCLTSLCQRRAAVPGSTPSARPATAHDARGGDLKGMDECDVGLVHQARVMRRAHGDLRPGLNEG